MKRLDGKTHVLGFCQNCIRVRWLAILLEPGDEGYETPEQGICRSCDRDLSLEESCGAVIWHGPGHQSKTRCQETGPHDIHSAVYGSMRQFAEWRGEEVMTGFFDEPPKLEE